MEEVWITGFRQYELGIFDEKDPKVTVIKRALKEQIKLALEEGAKWVITGGQNGIEQWAIQTVFELKKEEYDVQVALFLPYKEFAKRWKPERQAVLKELISKVDFFAYTSNRPYDSPNQLKSYQNFMLSHSQGAILVYDEQAESKASYVAQEIERYQENHDYQLQLIDFYNLQEIAELLNEERQE